MEFQNRREYEARVSDKPWRFPVSYRLSKFARLLRPNPLPSGVAAYLLNSLCVLFVNIEP